MNPLHKAILLSTSFLWPFALDAQLVYSNGATIFMSAGSVIISNGGVTVDNSTSLTNNGDFTITRNSTFTLPGTFSILNASVVQGNGTYRVEQDWVNNATFTAGSSSVLLNGNLEQFITSTNGTVTTFNALTLSGTGVGNNRRKTLQLVDARTGIGGQLNIGDRELATQTNTFFVLDPTTGSVTNNQVAGSEGFVSSTAPGTFSRAANSTGTYLFPTGSSNVITRYRPIELTPNASAADVYTVRFHNYNSDNDGFLRTQNDGVICNANDTFYHAIQRTSGTSAADVRMFYIPATDGSWNGMAHWRTSNVQWNDMATTAPGTSGVFTTLTRSGWAFANAGEPYILSELRPAPPTIVCPTICENTGGNVFIVQNGSGNYQWSVPGNGVIAGGQGSDTLFVNWGTGTGYVSVVEVTASGCNSLPDSCAPSVSPAPQANFADSSSGPWGNNWTFTDASGGAISWAWDFGDGTTSTQQNPQHNYTTAGTYTITLLVTNSAGCIDTITRIIQVEEGIFIPNVFTPNADGTNDEFYISSSGLLEYSIEIYNRWGVMVFAATAPEIRWDGRTTSGQPCSDGTYYFILKAISPTQDYSTSGFLTLIGTQKQ
ncbi:MAG: gliding motility-associated C-terminal domain-containing protein [Bacteroidia bacterium]|jgi:gliding motility-associated-like protein|nr:gliding motility-associated C-terminal domain-containing protein [Bacteroidia bacterium]